MTFTGTSLDLARLVDCCFAVTAPGPVLPIGQALVVEMGAEPVVVAEEDRPLYHAALAHGANHLVTLVAEALDLLTAARVEQPGTRPRPVALGRPRQRSPAGRRARSPGRSRAGTPAPSRRTWRRWRASGVEGALATYRRLARATADRALASGRLRPEAAQALLEALADRALGRRQDRHAAPAGARGPRTTAARGRRSPPPRRGAARG